MVQTPFTDKELTILYHHGTRGFIYNAERAAQKRAIDEWKNNDKKHEQLRELNKFFDMSQILLDTEHMNREYSEIHPGLSFNEGTFAAAEEAPFASPGMELKGIGDALARDVAKYFKKELTRLLEKSTLSKQQFIVFVLLWEEPSEYPAGRQLGERGVAENLDIAVGTVRSHHARAKEKIKKAEFTAGLTEYAVMEIDTAHEDTKTLLDEKL